MTPPFFFPFTGLHCLQYMETLVPRSVFLITPCLNILLCKFSVCVCGQPILITFEAFNSMTYSAPIALTSTLTPVPVTMTTPLFYNSPKLSISENTKLTHLTFWQPTPVSFSPSNFVPLYHAIPVLPIHHDLPLETLSGQYFSFPSICPSIIHT